MTKCLIECLVTYFYYLTDDVVVRLFCHLSEAYRELLEPSLINRVLILDCPFNSSAIGRITVHTVNRRTIVSTNGSTNGSINVYTIARTSARTNDQSNVYTIAYTIVSTINRLYERLHAYM
jgi:hypothetical protein